LRCGFDYLTFWSAFQFEVIARSRRSII